MKNFSTIYSKTGWLPAADWAAIFRGVGVLMGLVLLWAFLARGLPAYILPGPADTSAALWRLIERGRFFPDLGATVLRVTIGFSLAAILGGLVGILAGFYRPLGQLLEPLFSFVNSTSSAIWAIFGVLWFGFSPIATVFVVFMTAFPLITANVWQGTKAVDRQYIELGRSLHLGRGSILWQIVFPAILPYYLSGARLAFGFGFRVSIVAETIGASSGVGFRLRQAADLVQTDQVFAWALSLILLMLIIDKLILGPIERHAFRWQRQGN